MAQTPHMHELTLTVDPMFSALYMLQRDFQARLHGRIPLRLDGPAKMAYIREMAYALCDEVHEATDETGWKSWATSNHVNRDAYASELADVFIFLMNLMLVADVTPSELMALVKAKQVKNIKRQDEGYDGVATKCPACHRAYDDDAVTCSKSPAGAVSYGFCTVTGDWVDENGKAY